MSTPGDVCVCKCVVLNGGLGGGSSCAFFEIAVASWHAAVAARSAAAL